VVDFLTPFQFKQLQITTQNAFDLLDLCIEFGFNEYQMEVGEWISASPESLLSTVIRQLKSDQDTSRLESELSSQLVDYVDDDRLLELPVNLLSRVVRFPPETEREHFRQVLYLCMKIVDKRGPSASVLLHSLDAEALTSEDLMVIHQHGDFLWQFLGKSIHDTLIVLASATVQERQLVVAEHARVSELQTRYQDLAGSREAERRRLEGTIGQLRALVQRQEVRIEELTRENQQLRHGIERSESKSEIVSLRCESAAIRRQFATVPLPYHYVKVPQEGERANHPPFPVCYRVSRVITNLTRNAFALGGFTESRSRTQWNIEWGRQLDEVGSAECRNWQKVNHWPRAFLFGRKDGLHNRMMELNSRSPGCASFYPESYLLSQDRSQLAERWREHKVWIVKPYAGARARRIQLLDSSKSRPPPPSQNIVQVYIQRQFLIANRRFEVRLYAFVSSVTPLRIYLHDTGLVRFAEHEYRENGPVADLKMHLTNADPGQSKTWALDRLFAHLAQQSVSTMALRKEFERITTLTLIAGMCKIRESLSKANTRSWFELYGIDLIFDSDLKCYLMEVNISPSWTGLRSNLEGYVKFPLNLDVLRMARVIECDPTLPDPCPAAELLAEEVQRSISDERRQRVERREVKAWDDPVFADFIIVRDFIEETDLRTGFRLMYPTVEKLPVFRACFDKYCYEDVVFDEWISMSEPEQVSVLQKHWATFRSVMGRITETAAHR
jgi:tubulin polyglutamylase TTLL4